MVRYDCRDNFGARLADSPLKLHGNEVRQESVDSEAGTVYDTCAAGYRVPRRRRATVYLLSILKSQASISPLKTVVAGPVISTWFVSACHSINTEPPSMMTSHLRSTNPAWIAATAVAHAPVPQA